MWILNFVFSLLFLIASIKYSLRTLKDKDDDLEKKKSFVGIELLLSFGIIFSSMYSVISYRNVQVDIFEDIFIVSFYIVAGIESLSYLLERITLFKIFYFKLAIILVTGLVISITI